LATPTGEYALPVVLFDQTDLVVTIQGAVADAPGGHRAALRADPTDPNAFFLAWIGGACDNDAAISFGRSGGGFAVNVSVRGKLVLGCTAVGIARAVRIVTSEPMPIARITVTGGG
jgi:hypothetical protein